MALTHTYMRATYGLSEMHSVDAQSHFPSCIHRPIIMFQRLTYIPMMHITRTSTQEPHL